MHMHTALRVSKDINRLAFLQLRSAVLRMLLDVVSDLAFCSMQGPLVMLNRAGHSLRTSHCQGLRMRLPFTQGRMRWFLEQAQELFQCVGRLSMKTHKQNANKTPVSKLRGATDKYG